MLVISRTSGDSVMFGSETLLTVVKIDEDGAELQFSRGSNGEVLARQYVKRNDSTGLDELDIEVCVVDIRVFGEGTPTKVRLGIQAPRDLSVHRYEVYQAIRRESQPF